MISSFSLFWTGMFSFLSIEFAVLFIAFFGVYWLSRPSIYIQNLLLLIFSYFIIYLMVGMMPIAILLLFTSFIAWLAKMICNQPTRKKLWLILGIVTSLLHLSIYKYYDFYYNNIIQNLAYLNIDSSNIMANLLFPLGISYYTFQAISYLVTCYRQPANHDEPLLLGEIFLYLSFFGTITAGPISRVQASKGLVAIDDQPCDMQSNFQPDKPRQVLYPLLALALIVLALAKKWWWATTLADNWVNPVFDNPMQYHSLEVLTAIYGYTLQLYLDFSGYSEMMIAFGLLLGIRLPVNFQAPLLAHNIREFWNRWHISLSTWIRDYIYIPLGGNRGGLFVTQFNLLLAMVLSGIWHGSTLNFFFWGLFHGLALVLLNLGDLLFAKFVGKPKPYTKTGKNSLANTGIIGRIWGVFLTVNFVAFCFVFFRAKTFEEANLIFTALLQNYQNIVWQNNPIYALSIMLLAWVAYPYVRFFAQKHQTKINNLPIWLKLSTLFILFMVVVVFAPSGIPGFIYANF